MNIALFHESNRHKSRCRHIAKQPVPESHIDSGTVLSRIAPGSPVRATQSPIERLAVISGNTIGINQFKAFCGDFCTRFI